MDLWPLILKITVIHLLVSLSITRKQSKAFFVPVIEESDLAALGVVAARSEKDDDADDHVSRIVTDLATTAKLCDLVADPKSADVEQQSPLLPLRVTDSKESVISSSGPRTSGIRKRSRNNPGVLIREPSGRDLISQLDDEIEEQEMDKRSRIELLSYLDAAIKNKKIELKLELQHLAKEEQKLNLKTQDSLDADKDVQSLSSNIEQLNRRIKDLDERIVRMNRMKEEKFAQERANWRESLDKSEGYNIGSVKTGDNVLVGEKKAAVGQDTLNTKVVSSNVVPGGQAANLGPGSVPGGVLGGFPGLVPGGVPGCVPSPMSGPYVDPNVLAALPGPLGAVQPGTLGAAQPGPLGAVQPGTLGAVQPGPWWPMWLTQQWDGGFRPKWGQFPDNSQLPSPYPLPPGQRSASVASDSAEYNV